MKLHILKSSSKGNGYVLEAKDSALIIEAGVDSRHLKRSLDFNISKVVACLVSHEHKDHSAKAEQYAKNGIRVFASPGTVEALGFKSHNLVPILKAKNRIGDFEVRPFDVIHDVAEPFGFLIRHEACGTVLFVTDTQYIDARFPNLNQIIIEANYCEDILEADDRNGTISSFLSDRIRRSHMSIQTAMKLLEAQDLSKVRNIVLTHLSDTNSHAIRFREMVRKRFGRKVHIAESGMSIDFSLNPFQNLPKSKKQ